MNQPRSLRHRAQAGFTLIELIVVIVILGILAATALPKFSDLGADARVAKMNAARAALMTASSVAHGAYLAAGTAPASVTMEGSAVSLGFGYPSGAGIIVAAGGLADYVVVVTATGDTITPDASHATCSITYSTALSLAAPAVVSAAPTAANC